MVSTSPNYICFFSTDLSANELGNGFVQAVFDWLDEIVNTILCALCVFIFRDRLIYGKKFLTLIHMFFFSLCMWATINSAKSHLLLYIQRKEYVDN